MSKSMTSVDLAVNTFGSEGAKPIAEAISVSKSLTSIDLGYSEFGVEGGKAIAEAIPINIKSR